MIKHLTPRHLSDKERKEYEKSENSHVSYIPYLHHVINYNLISDEPLNDTTKNLYDLDVYVK